MYTNNNILSNFCFLLRCDQSSAQLIDQKICRQVDTRAQNNDYLNSEFSISIIFMSYNIMLFYLPIQCMYRSQWYARLPGTSCLTKPHWYSQMVDDFSQASTYLPACGKKKHKMNNFFLLRMWLVYLLHPKLHPNSNLLFCGYDVITNHL